jgi:hypothetical protein
MVREEYPSDKYCLKNSLKKELQSLRLIYQTVLRISCSFQGLHPSLQFCFLQVDRCGTFILQLFWVFLLDVFYSHICQPTVAQASCVYPKFGVSW